MLTKVKIFLFLFLFSGGKNCWIVTHFNAYLDFTITDDGEKKIKKNNRKKVHNDGNRRKTKGLEHWSKQDESLTTVQSFLHYSITLSEINWRKFFQTTEKTWSFNPEFAWID